MSIGGARWTALGLLAAALAALWQALKLSRWGFDGPGPGLFPQALGAVCAVLALAVLLAPASDDDAQAEGGGVERYGSAPPAQRHTFHVYLIALALLVAGTFWAGFVVTAFVVVVLMMRFGEGVGWLRSLGFAAACTALGLVCFGWLLRVSLPTGWVDRAIYAMLR
ncbi:tripartite tricarboxylate transporter TctB family protein [Chelatococcus reniformis]|uniref:DUF1468 domain-containing protein n=1 Tax=Chelatococcus reniformis TaxID=1494448 RepID=A0A916U9W8_9HYPH|nr:tripartite tricarboxylate transporter TctB family protein [Chelatococcus reniformis]GGC65966.1 hypothetical protein GCM10010994_25720 [Chelatococcus reniformis]